jgi:nitrate/nitrite-specific signal transduction histidine kinase
LISLINANVDDVVDTTVATSWLNAGQNQMATEARASFTQLDSTNANSTFDFPEKYHEIPVLYACAMFMASESSVGEKESYLTQFRNGLNSFIENYDIPVEFRDDSNTQQFTKSAGDNNTYVVTKRGYSESSNLRIYINGIQNEYFVLQGKSFVIQYNVITNPEPANGAKITAMWEDRPDLQEPPYPWMKAW